MDRLLADRGPSDVQQQHDLRPLDEYCQDQAELLHESASPLRQIAQDFLLTDAEIQALVICLAPEVDLRYQPLFAYLDDDVTRRLPTVDLCHRLGDGELALLDPAAPVFADGLIDAIRAPGTIWRGTGCCWPTPSARSC